MTVHLPGMGVSQKQALQYRKQSRKMGLIQKPLEIDGTFCGSCLINFFSLCNSIPTKMFMEGVGGTGGLHSTQDRGLGYIYMDH